MEVAGRYEAGLRLASGHLLDGVKQSILGAINKAHQQPLRGRNVMQWNCGMEVDEGSRDLNFCLDRMSCNREYWTVPLSRANGCDLPFTYPIVPHQNLPNFTSRLPLLFRGFS